MNKTFIINTITDWDEPPRARHQVAEALSKLNEVYFINANKVGLPKLKIIAVNQNLNIILPFWPIDYRIRYRLPILNEIYQHWLFQKIKKFLKEKDLTIINFDFTATQLFHYFHKVVYYCNDFNIRYYYLLPIKRYFERCEKHVAKKSVCCAATSEYLYNHIKVFNSNVIEIKLGAPNVEQITNFTKNKNIKVGFVGFLNERRTSTEIIKRLISDPNVEVLVYGKISSTLLASLKKYKNIKNNGILIGDQLLKHLNEIDVGIAPYNKADVNLGGTPNKLWLYLALGKPVVVSTLPMIKNWKFGEKFVYLADNEDEFVEKVYTAYADDTAELRLKRFRFAQENTWDKRIDELLKFINECSAKN